MKTKQESRFYYRRTYFKLCFCACLPFCAMAHEVNVHKQITLHAAASANELSASYNDFIATIGGPIPLSVNGGPAKTPFGWMIEGSEREDDADVPGDAGGKRSFNHFYDPISNEGLSDRGTFFAPGLLGRNSAIWAASDSPGLDVFSPSMFRNVNTHNDWSWNRARIYEFLGLTESTKVARDRNLAQMFRALGDIVHLLQDATQPQHVRNEQHLDYIRRFGLKLPSPWHSPIEKWGLDHVGELQYTHSMLDWRTAGFKKMQDFWDRDFYVWNRSNPTVRNPQPLIDSETDPTKKLGLAEFVNGNFIADRHTYAGIIPVNNALYYPYPDLNDGTDFQQLLADPAANKKPTWIPDVGSGYRYIVKKTSAQGREVSHHGAVTYLVAMNPEIGMDPGVYKASVDDPDVLKAYHDILIPEAIKYSAGLLDYFFRAKFDVCGGPSSTPGKYGLKITNKSGPGQDFGGGTFRLFYDDNSGLRTEISSPSFTTSYPGSLADGQSFDAEFIPPNAVVAKYLLVYKGTVGSSPPDPVDQDIAIAATDFTGNLCGFGLYRIAGYGDSTPQFQSPDCSPNSAKHEWCGVWNRDILIPPFHHILVDSSAVSINGKALKLIQIYGPTYIQYNTFTGVAWTLYLWADPTGCPGGQSDIWFGYLPTAVAPTEPVGTFNVITDYPRSDPRTQVIIERCQ